MKINRIDNSNTSPSFQMAWTKQSKQILSEAVEKLPKRKQSKAIQLINQLEQNSPFHKLRCINDRDLIADNTTQSGNHAFFCDGNFLKRLKKMASFVPKDTKQIPQVQALSEKLSKSLQFMQKEDLFDSGLRITQEDFPSLSIQLAKDLVKRKPKDVETFVTKLQTMDKQAKQNEINVSLGFQNRGYRIRIHYNEYVSGNKNEINTAQTFDKIHKDIQKAIRKKAKAQANEEAKWDRMIKKDEKYQRNQEIKAKIKTFIKSNPVTKTLKQVKDFILKPIQEFEAARKIQTQKNVEQISQKLEI